MTMTVLLSVRSCSNWCSCHSAAAEVASLQEECETGGLCAKVIDWLTQGQEMAFVALSGATILRDHRLRWSVGL